jgi:hypothetical protein
MSIVLIKVSDGASESPYYSGPPSNCPPVPTVGSFIEGTFGRGEVSRVEHTVDASLYTIKVYFDNVKRFHKIT